MRSRKSILLLIVLVAATASAMAEELEMGVVKYQYYSKLSNQLEDGVLRVIYDDQADNFILFLARASGTVRMRIAPADVDKLRANLEKYVEWEKLAVANQVELKKPLPNSAITGPAEWDEKSAKYAAPAITLSFDFLSRTKMLHILQLGANAVKSADGASTLALDIMYLDKPAAFAFEKVIAEKNVAAKRKALADQKAVQGLFQ
jgi:hypothetical protein